MVRTTATAEVRRRKLVELLAHRQSVSTADMARRFKVSTMTIRRDLAELQRAGAVVRCYGGAVPAQRIAFEFAFDERRRMRLAQKRRIGAAAAACVEAGQTVFLDTGTTTLQVARALSCLAQPCTVVTSSLMIASELWSCEHVQLMLLGGQVRHGSPDLVGAGTQLMLERLTADLAFLGSDGIEPSRGSFACDLETAQIAERMAANAEHVAVVADSSKLGIAGAVLYLPTHQMEHLISDREADMSAIRALREGGVKVSLT